MGGELEFESRYTSEIERDVGMAKEEHWEPGARRSLQL